MSDASPSLPPPTDQTALVGLLRHGQTVWNAEQRIQGQGDSPLTPIGQARVLAWAGKLSQDGWQHILCSDLGRAKETAELLNATLALPLTVDPRLREQHWGEWQGLPVAALRAMSEPELHRQTGIGWDFQPPGGESRHQVRDRALAALTAAHARLPGENILVITHLGLIKCLVYHLAGRAFLANEPPILTKDAFHILAWDHGRLGLQQLNISQPASR